MPTRSILFINRVYPPTNAATSHLLSGLAESLAREGWQVTVVTSRGSAGGARSEVLNGVHVERVGGLPFTRASHWKRALSYFSLYPAFLMRVWRLPRADVVVTMTDPPLQLALGPIVKWTKRPRLIHWAQDIYPELAEHLGVLRPGGFIAGFLRWCSTFALRRHDRVVVLGCCMKARMLQRGIAEEKIRVIPNWAVPLPPGAEPYDDGRAFRAEQGIGDRPVFMYCGNLGLAHPFEAIVEAAKRMRSSCPEALFLFVGDGPRLAQVKQATGGLENVRFLPFQPLEKLGPIVPTADLHLATMDEELCGLVVPSKVYGVLDAGRPCVFLGPKESEIGRLFQAHGCGLVLPSRDGAALAECLAGLAARPNELERLRRGAEEAAKEISLATAVRAFQSTLQELEGG